jgi:ceramide glucosyltransferase
VIALVIVCAIAAAYQITAILACLAHLRRRERQPASLPGVSILKPVYGADAAFFDAIRTHGAIDYPEFEILFGIRDPHDSAIPHIERFRSEFPQVAIRLIRCSTDAPNAKAGVLETLSREARFPIRVVNDSDIIVPRDYLRRLIASLEQPGVGLVTCLYRATGDTFPARFEALGIATDFAPSALVAPFAGVNEFGLGSTLAFRAADLERAGGFGSIRDYIADDYQVGKRISGLGHKVVMSRMPVETHLGDGSWGDVWTHQVRWARTIRLSKGLYFGLPVTFATLWAVVAAAAGMWTAAAALLALRLLTAILAGSVILRDPVVPRYLWLVPVRDLFGAVVWAAGAFGSEVMWRGSRLKLDPQGRIVGK